MMGRDGFRILGDAPVKDAANARVERAKENAGKKLRELGERGKEKMKELGERGREKLGTGTEKLLAAEEKVCRIFSEIWISHKNKANAIIALFMIDNMLRKCRKEDSPENPGNEEIKQSLQGLEDALNRKGARAHGSVSQYATWCHTRGGIPRQPIVGSGRGLSHLYVAQNRKVNDSAE